MPTPPMATAPSWARRLLVEGRVGRLATADADGQPSVVAVCYAMMNDRLYTAIDGKPKRTTRLRRVRDLAANPRVALLVDHWDEDWRRLAWISVRGSGVLLGSPDDGPEADRVERHAAVDALRHKYPQYGDDFPLADEAPLIRIETAEARWWRASEEVQA